MGSDNRRQEAAHAFLGSEIGRHGVWCLDGAISKYDLDRVPIKLDSDEEVEQGWVYEV